MGTDEKRWWLEASQDDWAAFEVLKSKENYSLAAFHLQQASEKILKAICLKEARPAFTHSCVELCHKIGAMGINVPEEVTAAARRLDPHYIFARYPNGLGGSPRDYYDAALIEELERCAQTLKSFAESQLSSRTG
jgi:HEPN domain-containing protein